MAGFGGDVDWRGPLRNAQVGMLAGGLAFLLFSLALIKPWWLRRAGLFEVIMKPWANQGPPEQASHLRLFSEQCVGISMP